MANVLVVYYSRKGENYMPGGVQFLEQGHTARAAEFIRDALGADLFEIRTVRDYPAGYQDCCKEAAAEARTHARPELAQYPADLSAYDTLFVCYPNWCGTAPMCVFTFLEHYDLTGKTIIPVCTNEGSGLASSELDIAKSCPGARLLPGLSVRGHQVKDSAQAIGDWAKKQLA